MTSRLMLAVAAALCVLTLEPGPAAAQKPDFQKTDFPMRLSVMVKCDRAHPIKPEMQTGLVESCVLRETEGGAKKRPCKAGRVATISKDRTHLESCT